MSQRVDVIRRPPIGKPQVIAEGVPLAEAGRLINTRQADVFWPLGLARAMRHVSRLVLLNEKKPIMSDWPNVTLTERDVERHVITNGGNIGMRCGDGLGVLDFDSEVAEREMMAKYGDLVPTVITGSGKRHYYFKLQLDIELPAKIRWEAKTVGEIQRTRSQQVVCPPSTHPVTGMPYVWAGPAKDLEYLPDVWIKALLEGSGERKVAYVSQGEVPSYIKTNDARGHEWDGSEWTGPDAEEIVRRAMLQPGAKVRGGGVKFQCPGCRSEGHDKHMDNAVVRYDGRWGCAISSDHRRAIGEALDIRREMPLVASPDGRLQETMKRMEAPLLDPLDGPLLDAVDGPMWEGK